MRFSYIDRRGREMELASVEELASRIELGVILPETLLYDAAEDQWGPAESHVAYRELAQELFAPGADRLDSGDETPGTELEAPVSELDPAEPEPLQSPVIQDVRSLQPDLGPLPGPFDEPVAADPPLPGPFNEPTGTDPPLPGPFDEPPVAEDLPLPGTVDAPVGEDPPLPGPFDTPVAEAPPLPGPFDTPVAEAPPLPGPFDTPVAASTPDSDPALEAEAVSGSEGISSGAEGEEWAPIGDPSAFPERSSSDEGLEREAFTDAPPQAFEEAGGASPTGLSALEFYRQQARAAQTDDEGSPATAGDPNARLAGDPAALPPLPPLPDYTAPTRDRSGPSTRTTITGTLGLILLVAVAGVIVSKAPNREAIADEARTRAAQMRQALTGLGSRDADATPPPTAAPEFILSPDAAPVVEGAMEITVAALDSLERAKRLSGNPGSIWLQGRYLAGASRYPEVRGYWATYREFLEESRAMQAGAFSHAVRSTLDGSDIAPDVRAAVEREAIAWFQVSQPHQQRVWDRVIALADASLDLHDYLVAHEDEIAYEPVRGNALSRDPILEAVPQSDEVADGMWEQLDRITDQLEQIQALRSVSTSALLESLFNDLVRSEPANRSVG